MAKLIAEKSGLPSKAEREAMQSRLKTLKQTFKTSTIAVFVQVSGKGSDAKAADALAEMLTHEGLGRAEAIGAELKFEIKPNNNQLRIISDTAKAFQNFLRKNPPTADYALLAEYGIGRFPDGRMAVDGIGLIVCGRNGDLGSGHWPEFAPARLPADQSPLVRRLQPPCRRSDEARSTLTI